VVVRSGTEFDPQFHIYYGDRVRNVIDGLPKYVNLPRQFGGDGKLMPEKTAVPRTSESFSSKLTKEAHQLQSANVTTVVSHESQSEGQMSGDESKSTNGTVNAAEAEQTTPTRKKNKPVSAVTDSDGETASPSRKVSSKSTKSPPSKRSKSTQQLEENVGAIESITSPSEKKTKKSSIVATTTDESSPASPASSKSPATRTSSKKKLSSPSVTSEAEGESTANEKKKRTKSKTSILESNGDESTPTSPSDSVSKSKKKSKAIAEVIDQELSEEVAPEKKKKSIKKSISTIEVDAVNDTATVKSTLKKKKSKIEV
jgi:hypothetical protein